MSDPILYTITPADPHGHQFKVELTIPIVCKEGIQLRLPSWIPGSYMIRDFAKNVVTIKAVQKAAQGNLELPITKRDKQTWLLAPNTDTITVEYWIYAWDMSVRTAHLDQTHAYFNGTSVFMEVVGHSESPCHVAINNSPLESHSEWRVATSLPSAGAESYGFGLYQAKSYQDLIDHPVEIGSFDLIQFNACGVPHDFVLTGLHNADLDRLAEDLTKICEHQIRFFGEPAPFDRYVFMTWAVGNGYGGLEHQASTSLICNRDDLPSPKQRGTMTDGYKTFLGLCSHEYFHSWNVKRIKPNIPYDLSQENHTPLLWAFEGITSYYDNLTLVRTGLISPQDYLNLLAQDLTRYVRNPGRFKQSAAESSFDAWTKFYKQDENSINAIVSYYTKGSLIALFLDLTLRRLSQNQVNLDTVMNALWQQHGLTEKAVAEQDIQNLCRTQLATCNVENSKLAELDYFLDTSIYATEDWNMSAGLEYFGVTFTQRTAASSNDNGGSLKPGNQQRLDLGMITTSDAMGAKIARVYNPGSAHSAGLSANDVIIAVNNIKADNANLEKLVDRYQPGEWISVTAFRRDELMEFKLQLNTASADTIDLSIADSVRLNNWLMVTTDH